jgi:hypothetical protein
MVTAKPDKYNLATNTNIFDEMKACITQQGEDYRNWFVGITTDIDRSLFVEHRVYRNDDPWIYRQCPNNRAAANIKWSLLKLGCDGYVGEWVNSPTIVYAYRKSRHSKP